MLMLLRIFAGAVAFGGGLLLLAIVQTLTDEVACVVERWWVAS